MVMKENNTITRRKALKLMAFTSAAGFVGLYSGNAAAKSVGAMLPGKGWLKQGGKCDGDGTPLQFIPKTAPDAEPLKDDLKKYQRCPYCGMVRKMWSHSRHLVQYSDNLVDGTCSIHCLAISLSLNLDRGVKGIYVGDFGAEGKIKPLVNVDKATYLIGSKLPGTMSAKSKMAFSDAGAAKKAMAEQGGQLGTFDDALKEAYMGMAKDTMMIRKRRAEKRKMMMKKMKMNK